jgi:hypothetical protein
MLLIFKNEIDNQHKIFSEKIIDDLITDLNFHDKKLKTARNHLFITTALLANYN